MKPLKAEVAVVTGAASGTGRALVRLLEAKKRELRERYGIRYRITGVASRRLGWIADARGIHPAKLLRSAAWHASSIDTRQSLSYRHLRAYI